MDNYVGKRLDGRYEIQEIIGVGGMAVVYKAYDNIDDRIVAVKILKEEFLANDEFRRRFKNESKAIAVLSHPNIVKVYDVSFGAKLQYIVMEYVDGITLKEYIEQQKVINWKEAVHFTTQILRALQHAHDKGIVHRDIKPQNIMLIQNGNIKVTDFGIARFSRSETRTMTESAIGSVHYISPEQARGEVTDEKADIYSVGVVLYEMLTGTLPFQSDSAVSVAIMQLQQEPKRPREINDSIPIGFEQITMRAMQKKPRDRFQSAAEMLLDLDEFKRNPQIKFDYSYFVDDEPTKFVGNIDNTTLQTQKNNIQESNTEEPEKTKATIGPVLIGILISLLVVIGIIFGVVAISKNAGSKVEVPDFKNQNYYTEILENEDYSLFEFEIKNEYNTAVATGTVLKQNPKAGRKIKEGTKITLTLAQGKGISIPEDILGKDADDVIKALEKLGFENIKTQDKYDEQFELGCVVDSSPKPGEICELNAEIILYVSSQTDPNSIQMLNYNDYTIDDLKMALEQIGLVLGDIKEVESAKPKGVIVNQSIPEGTLVPKGTKVDFEISTGITTATVTFDLPKRYGDGTVSCYLDGVKLQDKDRTYELNGKTITVEFQGNGTSVPFKIKINGVDYYSGTIDFAKNEVSAEYLWGTNTTPNVQGLTKEKAIEALKNAGFSESQIVIKETDVSNPAEDNIVKSQDETSNGIFSKPTITLTVGRIIETTPTEPDSTENNFFE